MCDIAHLLSARIYDNNANTAYRRYVHLAEYVCYDDMLFCCVLISRALSL